MSNALRNGFIFLFSGLLVLFFHPAIADSLAMQQGMIAALAQAVVPYSRYVSSIAGHGVFLVPAVFSICIGLGVIAAEFLSVALAVVSAAAATLAHWMKLAAVELAQRFHANMRIYFSRGRRVRVGAERDGDRIDQDASGRHGDN